MNERDENDNEQRRQPLPAAGAQKNELLSCKVTLSPAQLLVLAAVVGISYNGNIWLASMKNFQIKADTKVETHINMSAAKASVTNKNHRRVR